MRPPRALRVIAVIAAATAVTATVACGTDAPTAPDAAAPAPRPAAEPGRYLAPIFPDVRVSAGRTYGAAVPSGAAAAAPLLLDVYEPEGDTASVRPAIVWIHGGGFRGGARTAPQMVELARAFAQRGYVAVSISYRLRPGPVLTDTLGAIIDAVHDAHAAVRWLRANATAWRVDTSRIAIGGGSAGAVTAMGVAYADEFGEGGSGNAGWSSRVRAVVNFWGSLPSSYLEAGEAPLAIIHGTEDRTIPFTDAIALRDRATAVGLPLLFRPLEGVGHGDWRPLATYVGWIAPFLREHLALP